MSGESLLLGVDIGTTRAKVGAFHLDGRCAALKVANYEFPPAAEADGVEQDAGEWWRRVEGALKEITAEVSPSQLSALSVGGQGPTMVALNDRLEPIAPALTWMDRRAGEEARLLSQAAGAPVPAHAFLPKVMWLKRSRPGVYRSARWFCQAWDFIAARLTGEPVASTSAGIEPWSDDLLAASSLDGSKFPLIRRMGQPLGCVVAGAAAATGLPEGLPVIGGISDYFEGIIGSGAVHPGIACDNGGTSQSFNVCWDKPLQVDGVFCLASFNEGEWYIGGPASTTGKALDWWKHDVLGSAVDDWTCMEEASAVEVGSGGLIFLPYLAGERAPIWDAQARGAFFGLALHHRRSHMTHAILEAVAYTLCHLIEHIHRAGAVIDEIHTCGGQARSDLWCRIKADVTGIPVMVPEMLDAPVLGAAIIAGVGVGAFRNYVEGAGRMVRVRTIVEPNRDNHARYQNMCLLYRDLYRAVQPLYGRLANAA